MLLDIFVLPSSGKFVSEKGITRLMQTVGFNLCKSYMKVIDFADINKQFKLSPFYGVFKDNEYFDPRLKEALKKFLLYSRDIDMFSFFIYAKGSKNIIFQPRIFMRQYKLNPDRKDLPLPIDEKELKSEKILDGWLYRD